MKISSCFSISFIAMLAIITSCQKQKEELSLEGMIIVSANISDYTEADSTITTDPLILSWATGDRLGAFVKSGDGIPTELNLDKKTIIANQGFFDGPLTSNYEYIYAVYPYDILKTFENTNNVKYKFALPTIQNQKYRKDGIIDPMSAGNYSYKYGKSSSKVPVNQKFPMDMSHVMAIIDFNLTDLATDTKIYSLTLKSEEAIFATSAEVDFDIPSIITREVAEKSIIVNLKDNIDSSGVVSTNGKLTIRLAILPLSIAKDKKLTIELSTSLDDGNIATSKYSYTKTYLTKEIYKSGYRYNMNLSMVTDFVPDILIPEITANCIIVAPNTTVTVPINNVNVFWNRGGDGAIATKMENSENTAPDFNAPAIAKNLISDNTYKAELIWSDVDITPRINKITATGFEVSGLTAIGNYVVGVRKTTMPAGEYLWSWHLWVTDFDPEADKIELADGTVSMDRNLGATSAEINNIGALGLLYQWGRKDPFPNADGINSVITRPTYPNALPTPVMGGATILKYTSNPSTFYGGRYDADFITGYLSRSQSGNRWGGDLDKNISGKKDPNKSIYDPSPEGWRMSWGYGWVDDFKANLSVHMSGFVTYPGRTYTKDGKTVWFPATGTLVNGVIENGGVWGGYWGGAPLTMDHGMLMTFDGTKVLGNATSMSFGGSVRPVKE